MTVNGRASSDHTAAAEILELNDEVVSVRLGQCRGDPGIITINCPDKLGLACDLSQVVFDFGLDVSRLDVSTDGHWCLVMIWVVLGRRSHGGSMKWAMLKKRLVEICPSSRAPLYERFLPRPKQKEPQVLQVRCRDYPGLLYDIVRMLWEQEFVLHKAKAITTPHAQAFGLFYITDYRDMVQSKKRQEDVLRSLRAVLSNSNPMCEIGPAFPEWGGLEECTPLPSSSSSCLSSSVMDDLIVEGLLDLEPESKHSTPLPETSVVADNSLSPGHTLLQVSCRDRKGLQYDCMRVLKDLQIQVAYGRLSITPKGTADIDLFVLRPDGKKLIEPKAQDIVCSRLESEITNPVRVMIVTRGPDTELLVAAPIESSNRGRPQALCDSTFALKMLNICIFKADVGRHLIGKRKWEIYRFLLVDTPELRLVDSNTRSRIVAQVRQALIG